MQARTLHELHTSISARAGPAEPTAVAAARESEPFTASVMSATSETSPQRTAHLGLAARRALGGLLPLLDESTLCDVLVHVRDGVGQLWLDRGGPLELVPEWRTSPDTVRRLAMDLIAAGGRSIDELHPCADVRLGDGIRVHAMLAPVAVDGAVVSIRLPRTTPLTFNELVRGGLCDSGMADALRRAVVSRRNMLVTGGTGSGKTTVLAALLDLADPRERILIIEDVTELRLRHPHSLSLEARQASAEGVGEVPLDRLLRESLRMRPDRIVLGECRGAEIATLLSALNTGHDGSAGTLHASRLEHVPARLEALGALAGLSPVALARQAASALHLVVHLERGRQGRRIAAAGRLMLAEDGLLRIEEIRR